MKNIVVTKSAPAAIGPYSQGITTGQLPIDPLTGVMLTDNILTQTEQSLNNVKGVQKLLVPV